MHLISLPSSLSRSFSSLDLGIGYFINCPLEVLVHLLTEIEPNDLINLFKTCSFFRSFRYNSIFQSEYEKRWHLTVIRKYSKRSLKGLEESLRLESKYLVDVFLDKCWLNENQLEPNIFTRLRMVPSKEFQDYCYQRFSEFNSRKRSRLSLTRSGGRIRSSILTIA